MRCRGYRSHVTGGWQGGGWNQDPHGGQGGRYGADPYGQYGSDPYPQYGQPDPYGVDPYGGFPGFEPSPKRSKLPIVLSIVAIVVVVGAVLTIVLINRNEDDPAPTTAGGSTSASSKPPSSPKGPSSRRPPSTSAKPSTKDGWVTLEMNGGNYQVPADWKRDTVMRKSGQGNIEFMPGAVVGVYPCEGADYFRGFVAWGEAQSRDGAELDLNKTVTDFATSFAREYYREPKLDAPAPKPTTVDGKQAAAITVKLTVQPTKPACEATSGEVALIGYPIEKDGKPAGVRMLVVVNDLDGGPATPPGLPDPLAEEILGTLRIT